MAKKITLLDTSISKTFSLPSISSLDLIKTGLSGGFGSIYKTSIPGYSNIEFAVKIFNANDQKHGYETINSLITQINRTSTNSKGSIATITSLKALPLFSFKGKFKGKEVFGYVTYFLDKKFVSLDDILTDRKRREAYAKSISLDQRLLLVHQFCTGLAVLENIGYIHADINAQNIFIDMDNLELVIIDFDSGAMTNGDKKMPSTWGKPNEWIAPEIRKQMSNKNTSLHISIHTDRFAAMVGIHYLIFMQPPYCFLKNISEPTMNDYLKKYQWPNTPNRTETYYNRSCPVHEKISDYLKKHYYPLYRALVIGLNEGYFNTDQRVEYTQISSRTQPTQKPHTITKIKPKTTSKNNTVNTYSLKAYISPFIKKFSSILKSYIPVFLVVTSGTIVYLTYYSKTPNEYINNILTFQKNNKTLKKIYTSNNWILRFDTIETQPKKLVFNYTLLSIDTSRVLEGEGYIIDDKIYFDNKKNGNVHKENGLIQHISFGREILY